MMETLFLGSVAQNSNLPADYPCQTAFSGSRLPSRKAYWPATLFLAETVSDNDALRQPELGLQVGIRNFSHFQPKGFVCHHLA